MDIDKIITFCTVVEQDSFSKAAQLLYCSQPAISKQIAALEKEFGYPLFSRNGKKLTLNKNGEIVYQFGKHLQRDLAQLKQDLAEHNRPPGRMVNFGATNYIGIYVIPPLLSGFKSQYSDIAVSFTVDFLPNMVELLELDQIDFAFLPESKPVQNNPQYVYQQFCDDEMVLVCQPQHSLATVETISPQLLQQYPFLISQSKSATRQFVLGQLAKAGITLQNTIDLYNTEVIKQGIINGMGVSILSRFSVTNETANHLVACRPIEGVNLTRTLYLVHKKNRPLSAEARLFVNMACGGGLGSECQLTDLDYVVI